MILVILVHINMKEVEIILYLQVNSISIEIKEIKEVKQYKKIEV